jgi:hypothetical protein
VESGWADDEEDLIIDDLPEEKLNDEVPLIIDDAPKDGWADEEPLDDPLNDSIILLSEEEWADPLPPPSTISDTTINRVNITSDLRY